MIHEGIALVRRYLPSSLVRFQTNQIFCVLFRFFFFFSLKSTDELKD